MKLKQPLLRSTALFAFPLAVNLFFSISAAIASPKGFELIPKIIHRTNHSSANSPAQLSALSSSTISYHGGPLISTPTIYLIWYGNWNQKNGSDTPSGQQILRDFALQLDGSPYFAINTSYSTPSVPLSGAVTLGGEVTEKVSYGRKLKDADVFNIVSSEIIKKKLPYDPNGVYFLLTSTDVSELSGFCSYYCGWHSQARVKQGPVAYAFIGNPNKCLDACAVQAVGPNDNAGVDAMTSIFAHELSEMVTDPDVATGWYNQWGEENADICAWTFGSSFGLAQNGALYNLVLGSRNYLIQQNLYHTEGGDACVMAVP